MLPQQHNDYASSGMDPYAPVPYTGPVGAPVQANIVSVPSNFTFVVDNNRLGNNELRASRFGTAPIVSQTAQRQLQQMAASGVLNTMLLVAITHKYHKIAGYSPSQIVYRTVAI